MQALLREMGLGVLPSSQLVVGQHPVPEAKVMNLVGQRSSWPAQLPPLEVNAAHAASESCPCWIGPTDGGTKGVLFSEDQQRPPEAWAVVAAAAGLPPGKDPTSLSQQILPYPCCGKLYLGSL